MYIRDASENLYSISEGGMVKRFLQKYKLDKRPWSVAIIFICITWLPLLIFNLDFK